MDLREYDYITKRPDTFPRSTLMHIREILHRAGSSSIHLIDKVLRDGYIAPPPTYGWHGCYKIVLSTSEKALILDDLTAADACASESTTYSVQDRNRLAQYVGYWNRCLNESPVSYDEYKAAQKYYDLQNVSEEDFLDFLFNHEVASEKEQSDPWYFDFNIWIDYDWVHLAGLYESTFKSADKLLSRYSPKKLEQGCWAMMGENLECSVHNLIWTSDLEMQLKEKIVSSLYDLYKNLYALDPLDTSCDMWWDSLAFSYYEGGPRNPENNIVDKQIQDAMFQTLKKILELPSAPCQMAALHGLGHLRHPDTKPVIESYIRRNRDLTDDQITYAKACIDGNIM